MEDPPLPPTASKAVDSSKPSENGSPADKKPSGAELKKLRQAEKMAKRAAAKNQDTVEARVKAVQTQQPSKGKGSNPPKGQKQPQAQKRQTSPQRGEAKDGNRRDIPLRRRPSTGAVAGKPVVADKKVGLFGHLYVQPRRHVIAGASKEVHPSVLALGLQMSSYEICGSTARCVAMLLAFKNVINSYTTPHGTSLARHLVSHHLSPQIDYLRSCRPLSISMGNAIRHLKDAIVKIDPAVPEHEAKADLLEVIDNFIRDRVVAADEIIKESASQKIKNGDVILTYAKSSIVRATLLAAKSAGISFRVIVVDSKPLFEGKRLARELAAAGIEVSYFLISSASLAVQDATQTFLGAHAMMGNGRLYSRVGTAIIAMLAHEHDIPVIVCCESVKFTERVALDSIVANEVAPPEELLLDGHGGASASRDPGKAWEAIVKKWADTAGLQVLNVMYDVTPAEYIQMVVTEYGSLPPSSVPSVLRMLEPKG